MLVGLEWVFDLWDVGVDGGRGGYWVNGYKDFLSIECCEICRRWIMPF